MGLYRAGLYLMTVLSAATSQVLQYQCLPGLTVFNRTHSLLLNDGACNQAVDIRSLAEAPIITYSKASSNETYLLMMLESVTRNPDVFILHWLVSGVKSLGINLATIPGGQDLTAGYYSPVNLTQYEFRLYNMTGKTIWGAIPNRERTEFYASHWLAKNSIYTNPLARTIFNVTQFIAGPPGWLVPPYPAGQPPHPVTGQQPPYPSGQYPPQYPVPHQPAQPSQFPPQYPSQPTSPGHAAVQQYPPVQPALPAGQPPYPAQSPQPHYPPAVQTVPSTALHTASRNILINGTRFTIHSPGQPLYNPLNINSTIYSADTNNKSFKLTPYLIIDHVSYIRRNMTSAPGKGSYYYINQTLYVPYNPPSKEIHHHHYHKGSASSVTPTLLFIISLLPFVTEYMS